MFGAESRGFAGSVGLLVLGVLYDGSVIASVIQRRTGHRQPPLSVPGRGSAIAAASTAVGICVLIAGASGLSKAGSLSNMEATFACQNDEYPDFILATRGVTIVPVASGESQHFAAPILTAAKLIFLMDQTDALFREKSRFPYRLRQLNRLVGQQLADVVARKRQPVTAVQAISLKNTSVRRYIVSGGIAAPAIGSPVPLCISQDGNINLARVAVPLRP